MPAAAEVTATQLRAFVNTGDDHDVELQSCLDTCRELIEAYIDGAKVPDRIYGRALLLAAAEMFNQGQAPNGVVNQQYDDAVEVPVRIGSDPLRPAYPLLSRWVDPVIA